MAHKTLIGGTAYEIKGGKTLIDGTAYSIKSGKTLVAGTGYDISVMKYRYFTINGTLYPFAVDDGTNEAVSWSDFINSDFNDGSFVRYVYEYNTNGTVKHYGAKYNGAQVVNPSGGIVVWSASGSTSIIEDGAYRTQN